MNELNEKEVFVEDNTTDIELDAQSSDTFIDEDTQEISNIVERLEKECISAVERSDEERMEMIDNADVSDLDREINQSTNGLHIEEDPYLTEPLNTPEQIDNPGVPAEETIYEDCPRPIIEGEVNMDNYTNEEQYGQEKEYGQKVESGISGAINDEVEIVGEAEDERIYAEDTDYDDDDEEDEEMAIRKISLEADEEEVIEIPEELTEGDDVVVEEPVDTEEVDLEVEETPEEEEGEIEVDVDGDGDTDVEIEEDGDVEIKAEAGEDVEVSIGDEEVVVEEGETEENEGAVIDTEVYAGEVSDELTGELRKEVEEIELVNNANTKMFDDVSFLKDKDFKMSTGSDLDTAEDAAELVRDGVGVQETYTGEDVPETGVVAEEPAAEVGTEGFIPGAEEAGVEEELEEKVATESLRSVDTSRSYSSRSVLRNFWGK